MALEYRDGDELVIQANLPGLDPDRDVEVSLSYDVLHIRAGLDTGPDAMGDPSDLRYGAFTRDIALPPGTEEDKISASYHDGLLEVRAPIGSGHPPSVRIPVVRLPDEEQQTQSR